MSIYFSNKLIYPSTTSCVDLKHQTTYNNSQSATPEEITKKHHQEEEIRKNTPKFGALATPTDGYDPSHPDRPHHHSVMTEKEHQQRNKQIAGVSEEEYKCNKEEFALRHGQNTTIESDTYTCEYKDTTL